MAANAEKETKVHAERTDIGASLAIDPEDAKVPVLVELDQLALINRSHTQPPLDGSDERRTLEECTSQGFNGLRDGAKVR